MQRAARIVGKAFIGLGLLGLVWVLVVWQWQDPLTAVYTYFQQRGLASQLNREIAEYRPARIAQLVGDRRARVAAEERMVDQEATAFRRSAKIGQAIGRIVIPRIGLHMILVNGTDESSLMRGPGRDPRSYMPGQHRLVYIAGHRTTYLAPFANINLIDNGDRITLEMPYATFLYRAVRHRIVLADDLAVLRSPHYERLELQACHPRFFATHRYLVYADLVLVKPRGEPAYKPLR